MLAVLFGAWMILVVFAFSTMVDPALKDAARWSEILRTMVSGGGQGLSFGVVLICAGIWLATSKPKS